MVSINSAGDGYNDAQSFEKIFTSLCKRLSEINKVHEISKQFLSAKCDERRIETAYRHLSEQEMLPFNENAKTRLNSKSSRNSVDLRNEGNKVFGKVTADLKAALMIYTKSIAAAPFPDPKKEASDELALAFANRSAVLFTMGKYEECLGDIKQALQHNYPEKLRHKVLERRGKCFKQLGQIEDARTSYEEALASALSRDKAEAIILSMKQLDIENQACTRASKTNDVAKCLPAKTFGPNKEIPCASDCIEIKYSAEMGRYIEACKDISPGDVLLIEEPYSSVLEPQYYSTHCYNCLQRCLALIPCKTCDVMFCSEDCRASSWKKSHEIECSLLPHLHQFEMGKVWQLALRIIIIASKKFESLPEFQNEINLLEQKKNDDRTKGFSACGLYQSDNYSTVHYLVGNTDARSVSDLFKRATKAACILNCLEVHSNLFSNRIDTIEKPNLKFFVGGLILRHLQSLPCNAHSITDLTTQDNEQIPLSSEFGCGAYSTLSLINHSCDPNVTRSNFRGHVTVLTAVRLIKKGDQIMDNYGFHYAMQGKEERLTGLKIQYYFNCQCEPCTNDWPLYHNLPTKNPRYICGKCRAILPPRNSSRKTECSIVTCTECQHQNNLTEFEKKIVTVVEKFNSIYEKLLAGSNDNFIAELSDHLVTLDHIVVRPWRLFNDCQEAMKECFMRTGNFYK